MATASLRRFQTILIDGKASILHSCIDDVWQVQDPKTGLISQIPTKSLHEAYVHEKLKFVVGQLTPAELSEQLTRSEPRGKPENVSSEIWALALAKLKLVKSVCNLGWQSAVQKDETQRLWSGLTNKLKEKPPSPDASTVFRWWKKLNDFGWDGRSLLPRNWKKGRHPREICEELQSLIEYGVEAEYLTQERHNKDDAYSAVCNLVIARNEALPRADNLRQPTWMEIERYIDGLEAFDVYAARYGHPAAIVKFRSVLGGAIATAPLQRVELDHTRLDVMVLDDTTLLPLGRPWLAIAIDAYTRCILGFSIGFEPPCASTVAQCLRSALTPKQTLLASIKNILNFWDCFGLMETLVLDQAMENHAEFIDQMALRLGIEILYCPRKTPWFKARIERFLGTFSHNVCHKLSGTTFSNVLERGDYDAVGKAIYTVSGLRTAAIMWIVDQYHVKWHRTLQMAPMGLWNSSIRPEDIPMATDLQALSVSMRAPIQKPLTHKGIDIHNMLYNSDDLTALRRRHGAELPVLVYPSPSDIGSIIVEYPPMSKRFDVPCLNQDYAAGLTLWQHKSIRKFAKQQHIGVASPEQLLLAKHQLEAFLYENMADCPLKQRVRAARMLQKGRDPDGDMSSGRTMSADTGDTSPQQSRIRSDATSSEIDDYEDACVGLEVR